MSKKLKDWLTVALGVGITAKGVYDLLNSEEEDDNEIVDEKEVVVLADNREKSKYVDMKPEEVEIVEDIKKEEE